MYVYRTMDKRLHCTWTCYANQMPLSIKLPEDIQSVITLECLLELTVIIQCTDVCYFTNNMATCCSLEISSINVSVVNS